MKIKTLVIDDEPYALEKLKSYVKNIPYLELVAACSGTTEAMQFLCQNHIDVIFTDIDMPDVNGIKFIQNLQHRPIVVFITAYRDYALDGFRLSATDYLLKPYDMSDFQRAASKVYEAYKKVISQNDDKYVKESLFVKVETRFERLPVKDIRYIKGYGEYLQIFLVNRKSAVVTLSSFAEMKQHLDSRFIQIHRSYIINIDQVAGVEKNRVIMDAETYIPVSGSYRDDFINYLQQHSVGKMYKTSTNKLK